MKTIEFLVRVFFFPIIFLGEVWITVDRKIDKSEYYYHSDFIVEKLSKENIIGKHSIKPIKELLSRIK